jgi:hypothetical protein
LEKEGANCRRCLPHFGLLQGKCIKAYDYVSHGCKEHNLTGEEELDELRCDSCKANFVPIDVSHTFLCTEKKTLHQKLNFNKDQSFD